MAEPTSNNKYTIMQKAHYDNEGITGRMNIMNHGQHNSNPDYWEILVKDTENGFEEKTGLDFACGCGRNVINLVNRFKRMDGVDISPELVKTSTQNLKILGYVEPKVNFYVCNGVSLNCINNDTYDFVMTTIALQHICVYEIRLNYFKEFFRVMKSGGLLSIQMGFGYGHGNTRDYYDNFYEATSTNSGCDVRVDHPDQILNDLSNIGFTNASFKITKSWDDGHHFWIYVKAYKP
jgi:ubiquinone/menaquinone biosynthesis C-methylase UbiE